MTLKGMLVTSIALLCTVFIYSQNKIYKSGEIYTANEYLYGKMEVRMLAATGSGVISNFFTFKEGSELPSTFWEEIDIEVFGKDGANSWQSNLITGQGNSNLTRTEGVHPETGLGEEYHTYTIEWKPGSVLWRVDGEIIRQINGGQANLMDDLTSLRFNLWNPNIPGWVGSFNENILPVHMYVNWIKFYEWNGTSFDSSPTLVDDFDNFDTNTWTKANHTFAENMADFIPENVTTKNGYLVLSLTKSGQTGYNGTPPVDGTTSDNDPIANLGASPTSGQAPLTVSFDASDSYDPDGDSISYSWDFGDNTSGSGVSPSHVYTNDGSYTATLTVTDSNGNAATASVRIEVTDDIAINKIYKSGEIYTANEYLYGKMEVRMLAATGSGVISNFFTFKEGSELPSTFWEEIDIEVFGKDGANSWQSNLITGQGNSNLTRTEGVHPENGLGEEYHTYTIEWKPGSVLWRVDGEIIRQINGGQANLIDDLTSLRFNLWNPNIPEWVGQFNENILPVHMYVNWIKFYEWNGTSFDSSPTLVDDFDNFDTNTWTKANHTFAENMADFIPENVTTKNGYLVLSLTKSGQTGYNGTPPVDGTTSDNDPIANLDASPTSGQAPLTVSFDASDSYDPDGDSISYSWDFGDNTSGSGVAPSHVYTDDGSYTATLTVTDSNGNTATASVQIEVTDDIAIHNPVARVEASPISGQSPLRVSFDASDSSDPEGEALTYSWNFGDDTSGIGVAPEHVYTGVGTYTAVVTVTNESGGTSRASVQIEVERNDDGGDCSFGTPISEPLATIYNSYSNVYKLGSGGPNLSNVTNFVVNWDLYNKGLWQLSFNTNNGNPRWWMDLRVSSSHTFANSQPSITFSGTGIAGFDGEYYVNRVGDDFVMVSTDGDFSIYFAKSAGSPDCSKSFALTGTKDRFVVSPNPSKSYFNLSLPETLSKQNVTVKIYDISGKIIDTVASGLGNGELQFGENLKTGVYLGKVYENGSPVTNFTIIKE